MGWLYARALLIVNLNAYWTICASSISGGQVFHVPLRAFYLFDSDRATLIMPPLS